MREVKRMKVIIVGREKEIDKLKEKRTSTALEVQKPRLIKLKKKYQKLVPEYRAVTLPTL